MSIRLTLIRFHPTKISRGLVYQTLEFCLIVFLIGSIFSRVSLSTDYLCAGNSQSPSISFGFRGTKYWKRKFFPPGFLKGKEMVDMKHGLVCVGSRNTLYSQKVPRDILNLCEIYFIPMYIFLFCASLFFFGYWIQAFVLIFVVRILPLAIP